MSCGALAADHWSHDSRVRAGITIRVIPATLPNVRVLVPRVFLKFFAWSSVGVSSSRVYIKGGLDAEPNLGSISSIGRMDVRGVQVHNSYRKFPGRLPGRAGLQ